MHEKIAPKITKPKLMKLYDSNELAGGETIHRLNLTDYRITNLYVLLSQKKQKTNLYVESTGYTSPVASLLNMKILFHFKL